jgi:hypothetical protein
MDPTAHAEVTAVREVGFSIFHMQMHWEVSQLVEECATNGWNLKQVNYSTQIWSNEERSSLCLGVAGYRVVIANRVLYVVDMCRPARNWNDMIFLTVKSLLHASPVQCVLVQFTSPKWRWVCHISWSK